MYPCCLSFCFFNTFLLYAAEELSSQLAEFAFYEDADGDDTPHARTRSLSEKTDRDVRYHFLFCFLELHFSSSLEFPVLL